MTTSSKKVLVLRGDSYKAVGELFASRGMEVLHDIESHPIANVVVFTGGCDVHPSIYGKDFDGARGCDIDRDRSEVNTFRWSAYAGIPMIGICRGGQLLNVLNGGEMLQDHGLISGDVQAFRMDGNEIVEYNTFRVDHHQGMYRGTTGQSGFLVEHDYHDPTCYEIWYPETRSLCVQYHPEWGHEPTKNRFFELIERYEVLK